MKYINTKNITETKTLLTAASVYVAEKLGLKKVRSERMDTKEKKDPWWKRRIEGDIKIFQANISIFQSKYKGELRREQE